VIALHPEGELATPRRLRALHRSVAITRIARADRPASPRRYNPRYTASGKRRWASLRTWQPTRRPEARLFSDARSSSPPDRSLAAREACRVLAERPACGRIVTRRVCPWFARGIRRRILRRRISCPPGRRASAGKGRENERGQQKERRQRTHARRSYAVPLLRSSPNITRADTRDRRRRMLPKKRPALRRSSAHRCVRRVKGIVSAKLVWPPATQAADRTDRLDRSPCECSRRTRLIPLGRFARDPPSDPSARIVSV